MCKNSRLPDPQEEPGSSELVLQEIERGTLGSSNQRDPYFDTAEEDFVLAMRFDQLLRNSGHSKRGK